MPPSFRKARKSLSRRFRPFKSKRKSLRLRGHSPPGGGNSNKIIDPSPGVLSGDGDFRSSVFTSQSGGKDKSDEVGIIAKEVTNGQSVITPERSVDELVSDERDDCEEKDIFVGGSEDNDLTGDKADYRDSTIHPDPASIDMAANATEDIKGNEGTESIDGKSDDNDDYHTAAESDSFDEPIQYNANEGTQQGSKADISTTNSSTKKKEKTADNNENESPNPKSNDQTFNDGDHVEVIKRGHKKYGLTGIIERKTNCFVFIKEDKTGQLIKIKPASIALVSGASTDLEKPTEAVAIEAGTKRRTALLQSKTRSNRTSIEKPSDFPIRSNVTVVNTHAEHGGKVATVQRHTARFVVLKFKNENTRKEYRISPKFLVRDEKEPTDTISTLTSSLPTESECSGFTDTGKQSVSLAGQTSVASLSNKIGLGKFTVGKICLIDSTKGVDCAFKKYWNADKYLTYEVPLNSIDAVSSLPLSKCMNGQEYQLYYAEVNKGQSNGKLIKPKNVTIYYVASDDLRAHEEKLGDFGTLPPSKVWARRKLFLSPAIKHKFSTSNTKHAILPITADDITMVEDLGTVGCGFINENYLEDLLGNNAEAKRTIAIQVRIFVPAKGIFKGMLMRSRNGPPIQINESLRKVGPSRSDDASDEGYLVIKNKFQSKTNFEGASRLFQLRGRPMTKAFKDDVRKGKLCKLSPMYARVLQSLGVANKTIEEYRKQYQKNPENLSHTHVVGVADPTNTLPPGTVYFTGTANASFGLDQLLVSRSPCMEAKDIRLLHVVRTKPIGMTDDDWNWLQSLAFGALILANPQPGERPLPELVAEGDLDGDLYFLCWSPTILSEIQAIPITSEELTAPTTDDASTREYDPNWLGSCQSYISEVHNRHSNIDKLIGNLYTKSYEICDVRDFDAVNYSKAYKQALDAKKHGKQIYLPSSLWRELDVDLHQHLVSD